MYVPFTWHTKPGTCLILLSLVSPYFEGSFEILDFFKLRAPTGSETFAAVDRWGHSIEIFQIEQDTLLDC